MCSLVACCLTEFRVFKSGFFLKNFLLRIYVYYSLVLYLFVLSPKFCGKVITWLIVLLCMFSCKIFLSSKKKKSIFFREILHPTTCLVEVKLLISCLGIHPNLHQEKLFFTGLLYTVIHHILYSLYRTTSHQDRAYSRSKS